MSHRAIRVAPAPTPPVAYDVVIGADALVELPALLASHAPAARYALITDDNVRDLHANRLADQMAGAGLRTDVFSFPAGESFKTRDTWSTLADALSRAGLGRDACVIACGGGVVGDVAGFVAATYLRGIPCVQIPTTLLSMLDASVGGKTGVDTMSGKNLVGAFHQPRLVVMDPSVLLTQQPRDRIMGLAEGVKHGCIVDAQYLEWIAENAQRLVNGDVHATAPLIARSVEIKADVVGRDPFERGERAILNFGHTIAHALEHLTAYRVPHGQAVACGMVVEARIGEALGVTEKGTADAISAVLHAVGLPAEMPAELDAAAIIQATRSDKKNRGGHVQYVLIERIGAVVRDRAHAWTHAVPDDVVLKALR